MGLPQAITLTPATGPFTATLSPPGSKSLTNRALVLAALAGGDCTVSNILIADDTAVMLEGLQSLGFEVATDTAARRVIVRGGGGKVPARAAMLFCGNSGTTIRFLAAVCCLGKGSFTLDGVARMRQRPIRDGVALLRNLGARIDYLGESGFPPIRVDAGGLAGGIAVYDSAVSSQYLSAVLMVAPCARHEVRIELTPGQTSWPYVAMTMQLMDQFGVTPEMVRDPSTGQPREIIVPQERYAATAYTVEPDASNAAYFLAAAAVNPGARVTVANLGSSSLQGDVKFADVLRQMGAAVEVERDSITVTGTQELEGIDIDLRDMPDQAQTLAVVAVLARGQTVIRGLHTLRVKETDRLAALRNELVKLGAEARVAEDESLTIQPPAALRAARIATYDDHRMAMSFAVAGTRAPGITIENPTCVNKTYPGFFEDLRKVLGEG
jgi:3-phosphoshikimate 1-carboxyvinyltransferase